MIKLDSFSGDVVDLKKSDRTPFNILRSINKNGLISTWDFQDSNWLWKSVRDLKRHSLLEEISSQYPWHKYKLTPKGLEFLTNGDSPLI